MNIINAAPKAYLLGTEDLSGGQLVVEPELLATHLPHVYLFAEKGSTLPQVVVGDSAMRYFGSRTFDLRDKFATHQNLLYNACTKYGNSMLVQRVIPADAPPPAGFALWLDLSAEDEVPQYVRNADGSIQKDANTGIAVPLMTTGGSPVQVLLPGHIGRIVVTALPRVNKDGVVITPAMIATYNGGDTSVDIKPVANLMGSLSPVTGAITNTDAVVSTRYPLLEFEVSHVGSYGDNYGIRLWPSTARSSTPPDLRAVNDNAAFMYNMQVVRRPDAVSTPVIERTLDSEVSVPFMFKPGALNRATDQELYFDLRAIAPWENLESVTGIPLHGPFGRNHTYQANIETISGMIAVRENTANPSVSAAAADRLLINWMTGENLDGNNYLTYQLQGPSQGGYLLNGASTIYATGGGDGTMTFDTFDALVKTQLENYGDLEAPLLDMAQYPVSVLYDTGFTLPTKKKMFVPMGRRKDVNVIVSTQAGNEPANTESEDSSIGIVLQTEARLYPESETYGTGTCRAMVVGQSGFLLGSQWSANTPLTVYVAERFAEYMGSGTGIWDSKKKPDESPNNWITGFRGVNNRYKKDDARVKDWTNGLVWAQHFDRRTLFIPAYQTVYADDTSTLNNIFTSFIIADLEKVCFRTWAQLTGNNSLTEDQYIERSNRLISDAVRNKYDNRAIIIPETFISGGDAARGYSFSCKVNLYTNTMKTVGSYTIVARRRTELAV